MEEITQYTKEIDIYGRKIPITCIEYNKKLFCPAKEICINIGIAWQSQLRKIRANRLLKEKIRILPIQTNRGLQNTVVIEIQAIIPWLHTINLSKTKKYRKENVFIYFILSKSNNLIKIGKTTNIKKRFKLLQATSPVELELIGIIEGNHELEEEIHYLFNRIRHHGEWFKATKELMEFIEKYAKNELEIYGQV